MFSLADTLDSGNLHCISKMRCCSLWLVSPPIGRQNLSWKRILSRLKHVRTVLMKGYFSVFLDY